MLDWHENLVRKISKRNLDLAILGKFLAILSLGSIFSIDLVRYGLFILIIGVLITIGYLNRNFISWHQNKEITYKRHVYGFIGAGLLMLFLGIQLTFLPFKIYVLIIGIIITIPALIDIIKK